MMSRGRAMEEVIRERCGGKISERSTAWMNKEEMERKGGPYSITPTVLTHGLQHLRHIQCDEPVCNMTHGSGEVGFVSLHQQGAVQFYSADGRLYNGVPPAIPHVPYAGLTCSQVPGRIVGWGPGASLVLLDNRLRPLIRAAEPLDIRTCLATGDESPELVTAGLGNVCLWALTHLVCRARVLQGLDPDSVFTQLAVAPKSPQSPRRAFAACRSSVAVINLTDGKLLEYRRNLHPREITGLTHCHLLDALVTTAKDMSIRVWGADWELRMVFVGHTGMVIGLVCIPHSALLLSASLDRTLRCWDLEQGDQVQEVQVQLPPLALGGPGEGGTFCSFSQEGVDFWSMASVFRLHCCVSGERGVALQQVTVPRLPQPFPLRALCLSTDGCLSLVAVETGAILSTLALDPGLKATAAEYCLPEETFVVLTEDGNVVKACALTSPASILETWHRAGQKRSAPRVHLGDEHRHEQLPGSSRALCLTLYNNIGDPRGALEDWQGLQEQQSWRLYRRKGVHGTRNQYLIILGHEGGGITVLKWHSGEVQYTTTAHSSSSVTALQADPDNNNLFSMGGDRSVFVWRVFPFAEECLSLQQSLLCEQPPTHFAPLGTLLALALQEPDSATYSLVHLNLQNQQRSDHPPSEDHLDAVIGLCACPEVRLFASSSRDGTVRIWNEENHLLRTLQLNVVPECVASCGDWGDLLLGICGDLYHIHHTQLLPQDHEVQLLCTEKPDLILSFPVSRSQNKYGLATLECFSQKEEEKLRKEEARDLDYTGLVAHSRDLERLKEGTVERKKKKLVTSRQPKRAALNPYMKLIHSEAPLCTKVSNEEPKDLQGTQVPPGQLTDRPESFSNQRLVRSPASMAFTEQTDSDNDEVIFLVYSEEEEQEEEQEHLDMGSLAWMDLSPPARVVEVPSAPPANGYTATAGHSDHRQVAFSSPTVPLPPLHSKPGPVLLPRTESESAPPEPPREPVALQHSTPSPHLPEFLRHFVLQDWFTKLFPNLRPLCKLTPESFALLLLINMKGGLAETRMKLLHALLGLCHQGVLEVSEQLSTGLIDVLRSSASRSTPGEKRFSRELISALLGLGILSQDLLIELLSLVASGEQELRDMALGALKAVGVTEAELWLIPGLEPWGSDLAGKQDSWTTLRTMVTEWLHTWTIQYKNQALILQHPGAKDVFSPVDVLNHFCSQQKEREELLSQSAPLDRREAPLLPQLHRPQPIHRLGETHTSGRKHRTHGVTLPPLLQRPFLTGFTKFISLPMPRVSPGPYPFCIIVREEQEHLKGAAQRYFVLEQSYVDYYR